MNGKKKRHGEGRGRDGRRKPPPEWTGAEDQYLDDRRECNVPMRIQLRDGSTVRGLLEHYDRDTIKIQSDAGPALLIRKSDIRYLQEDPEDSDDS